MMQLFNEINARKIHDERNVFDGIFRNPHLLHHRAGHLCHPGTRPPCWPGWREGSSGQRSPLGSAMGVQTSALAPDGLSASVSPFPLQIVIVQFGEALQLLPAAAGPVDVVHFHRVRRARLGPGECCRWAAQEGLSAGRPSSTGRGTPGSSPIGPGSLQGLAVWPHFWGWAMGVDLASHDGHLGIATVILLPSVYCRGLPRWC